MLSLSPKLLLAWWRLGAVAGDTNVFQPTLNANSGALDGDSIRFGGGEQDPTGKFLKPDSESCSRYAEYSDFAGFLGLSPCITMSIPLT